ncbi:hypothetical protein N9L76_08745 [bacterium]|nr:hypothetical protein [bacterium]
MGIHEENVALLNTEPKPRSARSWRAPLVGLAVVGTVRTGYPSNHRTLPTPVAAAFRPPPHPLVPSSHGLVPKLTSSPIL